MSEKLIQLLRHLDPNFEARTICESLWLATYLPQRDDVTPEELTDQADGADHLENEDRDTDEAATGRQGTDTGQKPDPQPAPGAAQILTVPSDSDGQKVSVGTAAVIAARKQIRQSLKPQAADRPS